MLVINNQLFAISELEAAIVSGALQLGGPTEIAVEHRTTGEYYELLTTTPSGLSKVVIILLYG